MKKLSLLVSGLLVSGMAIGQGTELFFSEYIEGAGAGNNDKALEIFNPTLDVVDVRQYSIRRYSNGAVAFDTEERLNADAGPASNLVSSQDVFVVVNPGSTIGGHLLAVADQISGPHPSSGGATAPNTILGGGVVYANGNDAHALVRWVGGLPGATGATPVIVDIFGKVGEDPTVTTGWAGVQPGTPATISSANHSLMRKPTVSGGVTDINAPFDITQEWIAYSVFDADAPVTQDFSRLGDHADYAGPSGSYVLGADLDRFNRSIKMYPNPASDRVVINFEHNNVGAVAVVNSLGQVVSTHTNTPGSATVELNVNNLASGIYFVKFVSLDGKIGVYKELIVQ